MTLSPIYDTIKELHAKELQEQQETLLQEFEKRLKQPMYGKAVQDSLQFINKLRERRETVQ